MGSKGAILGGVAPFCIGPQATGGRREYGERVAGTWEREMERAPVG
jgi:hypothetical protein